MDEPEFEWDGAKAESNLRKHGVSFPEATTVFRDRHARLRGERVRGDEVRQVIIGLSDVGRLLVVVFVDRGRIRIISTRRPTPFERHAYQQADA